MDLISRKVIASRPEKEETRGIMTPESIPLGRSIRIVRRAYGEIRVDMTHDSLVPIALDEANRANGGLR